MAEDPVQCYVLEEAQREGLIDVEGVFLAGNSIYMYVSQPESPILGEFMLAKAREFIDRWPERVSYNLEIHQCPQSTSGTAGYSECMLRWTFWEAGEITPWDSPYSRILLKTGGVSARYEIGGWASWKQLWPKEGGQRSTRSVEGPGRFDVSGVDIDSVPTDGCHFPHSRTDCSLWTRFPELDITLWAAYVKVYVHIKAEPDDEAKIQLARDTLTEKFGADVGDRLVIVPVKYDYGELQRWAIILKRFSVSRGNSVGLINAQATSTVGTYPDGSIYLGGLEPAPLRPEEERYTKIRMTVVVWSHDSEELEKRLPQLLRALDLPQDAVGIIGQDPQYSAGAWVPIPEGGLAPGALIEAGSEVAESAALVASALVLLASLRLLRHRGRANDAAG